MPEWEFEGKMYELDEDGFLTDWKFGKKEWQIRWQKRMVVNLKNLTGS